MLIPLADSILSPLGSTTEAHLQAVVQGRSAFSLSLPLEDSPRLTRFEQAIRHVTRQAVLLSGIQADRADTLFILSTTKGNIALLDPTSPKYDGERVDLWASAQWLCQEFGNPNAPVVVSNACISGACAQIAALRESATARYRHFVVVGADMRSPFVSSGFASFKALSPERCMPFDARRKGLNLGEAAAAIVYRRFDPDDAPTPNTVVLERGVIRNDANHISGPSRTAEGLTRCLETLLQGIDKKQIAFVNAHGTATLYNDDMESIALHRMGLDTTPVNSLKAYFGHTLGAAGILESIISLHALEQGLLIPSLGFEQTGTPYPLNIIREQGHSDKPYCIKMLSGFGGTNAALLFRRMES